MVPAGLDTGRSPPVGWPDDDERNRKFALDLEEAMAGPGHGRLCVRPSTGHRGPGACWFPAPLLVFSLIAIGWPWPAAAASAARPVSAKETELGARRSLAACLPENDPACPARSRLALASALARLGKPDEARRELDLAKEDADRLHDPALAARALWRLAALEPTARSRVALARLDDAVIRLGPGGVNRDGELLVELDLARGDRLLSLGLNAEARDAFERAARATASHSSPGAGVEVLRGLARVDLAVGKVDDAADRLLQALNLAREKGLPREQAGSQLDLADLDLDRGRRRSSEEGAREAARLAESAGLPGLASAADLVLVEALLSREAWNDAADAGDAAIRMAALTGEPVRSLRAILEVAVAELDHDLFGAAVDRLRIAEPLFGKAGQDESVVLDRLVLEVGIAQAVGDLTGAEKRLREALSKAVADKDAELEARLHGRLGVILRTAKRTGEAVTEHRTAIAKLGTGRFAGDGWWLWNELAASLFEDHRPDGEVESAFAKSLSLIPDALDAPRSRRLRRVHRPDIHEALRRVVSFRLHTKDTAGAFEAADLAFARRALAVATTAGGAAEHPATVAGLSMRLGIALGRDRVLVAGLSGETKSFVFVVRAAGVEVHSAPGASEIRKLAAAVHEGLAGNAGLPVAPLEALAKAVMPKLADRGGSWPSEVLFVADPVFEAIPLELIPIGGNEKGRPRLLLDEAVVARVSSATSWLASRIRSPLELSPARSLLLRSSAAGGAAAGAGPNENPAGGRGSIEAAPEAVRERGLGVLLGTGVNWLEIEPAIFYRREIPALDAAPSSPVALSRLARGGPRAAVILAGRRGDDAGKGAAPSEGRGVPSPEMCVADSFLASGSGAVFLPLEALAEPAGARLLSVVRNRLGRGDTAGEAIRRAKLEVLASADPAAPRAVAALALFGEPDARVRRSWRPLVLLVAGVVGALLLATAVVRALNRS